MLCACCAIRPATIEEVCDDSERFTLCHDCYKRLTHCALRPLEFFTLMLRHGSWVFYLHDDFYDDETGEALQPQMDVAESEKYLFPGLEELACNPALLVGYALAKDTIGDALIAEIQKVPKEEVLRFVSEAAHRNEMFASSAYDIVARALGPFAGEWVRNEWDSGKGEGSLLAAGAVIACLPFEEAFESLTRRIESANAEDFHHRCYVLAEFRSERVLDWLENMEERLTPVRESWGRIAAMSQFSWKRARMWLRKGRPLSLVALDALRLCTTPADMLESEPLWVRESKPQLSDAPAAGEILGELAAYLEKDASPRIERAIAAIRANIRHEGKPS